jgi:hypothetical protein
MIPASEFGTEQQAHWDPDGYLTPDLAEFEREFDPDVDADECQLLQDEDDEEEDGDAAPTPAAE